MGEIVKEGIEILNSEIDICQFGLLLNDAWLAKKELRPKISNGYTEQIYTHAVDLGALGGKITGAGGGGFLLLFVPPHKQRIIAEQ